MCDTVCVWRLFVWGLKEGVGVWGVKGVEDEKGRGGQMTLGL